MQWFRNLLNFLQQTPAGIHVIEFDNDFVGGDFRFRLRTSVFKDDSRK
jgi:hypothetical protein